MYWYALSVLNVTVIGTFCIVLEAESGVFESVQPNIKKKDENSIIIVFILQVKCCYSHELSSLIEQGQSHQCDHSLCATRSHF